MHCGPGAICVDRAVANKENVMRANKTSLFMACCVLST